MLSSIFHFGQISKFKKGVTPRKKRNQKFLWICTSTNYVLYYYKVSGNSVERFQRSCANKLCWVVSFILAKFLSSKRVLLREKKWNQNFLWICPSTHYVLNNYKVLRNSVEWFQRSCTNNKNRTDRLTDWLTDWRTDGSKTLYPPQLVAWGIKILIEHRMFHSRNTIFINKCPSQQNMV